MPLRRSPNARHSWTSGSCAAWQPCKPEPATNGISVECDLTDVVVSARPFAELVAPPTMRHQSETPTAAIANLTLLSVDSHDVLLRIPHNSLVAVSSARALNMSYRATISQLVRISSIDCICRPDTLILGISPAAIYCTRVLRNELPVCCDKLRIRSPTLFSRGSFVLGAAGTRRLR